MRQLVYGEPLVLQNVPEPVPGPGEVVIDIKRAAVNPLDVWVSRGTVAAAGPLPRTGGSEGAGVTEEGRRVAFRGAGIGVARDGSYAERIAVPAAGLADVPDAVTDAQAAGVGVAGVTALRHHRAGRGRGGHDRAGAGRVRRRRLLHRADGPRARRTGDRADVARRKRRRPARAGRRRRGVVRRRPRRRGSATSAPASTWCSTRSADRSPSRRRRHWGAVA